MKPNNASPSAPRFWEAGYGDMAVSTMGGPSVEVVEIERGLPRGARVLDLGCGEGRNAVFLAARGHRVTALDLSAHAIAKLADLSTRLNLGIDAQVGDVGMFEPSDTYDLVLAHCSLHFIPKTRWMPLLRKLKALTRPGGFHNITSIIGTDAFPVPPECRHANSFERGDLDVFFADWRTLRSDYYAKWDAHPNIPVHVHVIEKFVAQKPLAADQVADNGNAPCIVALPCDDVLDAGLFEAARIGMSAEQLEALGIRPWRVHRTSLDDTVMGSTRVLQRGYKVEDWLFGRHGLQLIDGELRGKYLYFTPPVAIEIAPPR